MSTLVCSHFHTSTCLCIYVILKGWTVYKTPPISPKTSLTHIFMLYACAAMPCHPVSTGHRKMAAQNRTVEVIICLGNRNSKWFIPSVAWENFSISSVPKNKPTAVLGKVKCKNQKDMSLDVPDTNIIIVKKTFNLHICFGTSAFIWHHLQMSVQWSKLHGETWYCNWQSSS